MKTKGQRKSKNVYVDKDGSGGYPADPVKRKKVINRIEKSKGLGKAARTDVARKLTGSVNTMALSAVMREHSRIGKKD